MEYELAFYNFDYKIIRKKLKKIGGKIIHKFVLYNVAYFYLSGKNNFSSGFVRVRNENGKIVLTTKILGKSTYPEEYETEVNTTYENIIKILENSGLIKTIESVKYREKWLVPETHEVVFDIWPGLPISLEIDCESEENLKKTCKKLELNIDEGFTGSQYYYLYGIKNDEMKNFPNLNFLNFKKYLKKNIKKNMNEFKKINKEYYKQFLIM